MLFRQKLMVLVLVVVSAVMWGAAAAEVVNRVIAVVDDDLITAADLEKMVASLEASLGPAPNAQAAAKRRQELIPFALQKLIEDKILAHEVTRQKTRISDKAVDNYIKRIKDSNNISEEEFAAQLRRRGMTPQEYQEQVKKDLLKHKLINDQVRSQVVVSDEQVNEYYQKHEGQYQNMDQVRLRALFIKAPQEATPAAREALFQKTEELRAQVLKSNDFAGMAVKYSQGPGAENGGELGPLSTSDMLPAMRQALAELKPGQISPVIRLPDGFVFMQLLERSGGKSGLPLQQVREQIRAKLEDEIFQKRFKEWLQELTSKTYVRIIK